MVIWWGFEYMKKKWLILVVCVVCAVVLFNLWPSSKQNLEEVPIPQDYAVITLEPEEIEEINKKVEKDNLENQSIVIANQEIVPEVDKEEMSEKLSSASTQFFLLQFIGPLQAEWKSVGETKCCIF